MTSWKTLTRNQIETCRRIAIAGVALIACSLTNSLWASEQELSAPQANGVVELLTILEVDSEANEPIDASVDADDHSTDEHSPVEQLLEQVSFQLRTERNSSVPTDEESQNETSDDTAVGASKSTTSDPTGGAVELESDGKGSALFVKHRWEEESFDWVFRSGDQGLGVFSIKSSSSRDIDLNDSSKFDIRIGYGIHFLSGPLKSDLPPRLFDLYFNVRWLQQLGDGWGVDANFDLGLYTDFEDSVRKGWRYPGRALAFWNLNGEESETGLTLMAGLEFFDTDQLRAIPAGGLVWEPDDTTRYELYFPRPQVKLRLSHDEKSDEWLYVRGELLGSAWAIERMNGDADVASLTERRIAIGLETRSLEADGNTSFMEVGYVFDRELQYRSGRGNLHPDNAMMFRMGSRY